MAGLIHGHLLLLKHEEKGGEKMLEDCVQAVMDGIRSIQGRPHDPVIRGNEARMSFQCYVGMSSCFVDLRIARKHNGIRDLSPDMSEVILRLVGVIFGPDKTWGYNGKSVIRISEDPYYLEVLGHRPVMEVVGAPSKREYGAHPNYK